MQQVQAVLTGFLHCTSVEEAPKWIPPTLWRHLLRMIHQLLVPGRIFLPNPYENSDPQWKHQTCVLIMIVIMYGLGISKGLGNQQKKRLKRSKRLVLCTVVFTTPIVIVLAPSLRPRILDGASAVQRFAQPPRPNDSLVSPSPTPHYWPAPHPN